MTQQDKEKLVNRILLGSIRILINNRVYWLRNPTLIERLEASYVYDDVLQRGESNGVLNREDYIKLAYKKNEWNKKLEKELTTCGNNIEVLKIEYYKNCFKTSKKELALKSLLKTKSYYYSLIEQKEKNFVYSAESIAETAKFKYLVGKCLLQSDNKTPVWNNNDFNDSAHLLNSAYVFWSNLRFTEREVRELARSEYWRGIWGSRKECKSLIDCSSAELGDEQKAIITWSRIYDGAFEDNDFFGEVALNEDDMFDGYLLMRKKEREKQQAKSRVEKVLEGSKNANAGEVFIMAESEEEIKEIEGMNDEYSASIKKMRLNQINQQGIVHEAQMHDSKREIMMMAAQKFRGQK